MCIQIDIVMGHYKRRQRLVQRFQKSALYVWVRVSRTEQVISSYFVVIYGMFSSEVTLEKLFLTDVDIEGKCDSHRTLFYASIGSQRNTPRE